MGHLQLFIVLWLSFIPAVLCCVVVHVQGTPATVTHGRMLKLVLELVTVVYIYLICIPSLSYFVSVVGLVPL